jgi:L-gulonolactone oxidase
MHQELILSLVEELSKKWLELDSFYPINLRISGADEAFLSPSFGRKSLWVDFVMQDSKEMSLLREFETWHIVNNFGGRPHFGKYMNPERYDFSSLYSNLNLFVETINSLDPKGFFNSVLLEHV